MKLKYMIVGFIAGAIAATALTAGASTVYEKFTAVARPDYKLVVDGESAKLNNSPVTINGSSYLPVREVATILDADVSFNSGIINITTKEESEGDKVTTPTTESSKETTISSEWISLRELATNGINVQLDPNNVITISNKENEIKFYSTDIVKNDTVEAEIIEGEGVISIKSDKGLTYLKTSELRTAGILD